MKSSFLFSLVFLLVVGVSSLALLNPHFFRIHDFSQGARIVEFERSFRDGQVPPRWSKNFGFGYGMPTFLFYGPFPYLLPALVYWLTNSMLFSLQTLWLVPSVVSFLGMYFFIKRQMGRAAALIAATAFTLAPYRAVDLYVRGALGEVWGIMLFPIILLFLQRYIELPSRKWFLALSVSIGVLFVTHNLMALLFLPVIFLFGFSYQLSEQFIQKNQSFSVKKCTRWCIAVIAGGCLSLFYTLPALLEKNATQIDERILGGYFHYSQHFLYVRQFFLENWKYGGSNWGPTDDMSFFLGYGQLMLLAMAVLCIMYFCVKFFVPQFKHHIFLDKYLSFPNSPQQKQVFVFFLLSIGGFILSCFFTIMRSKFIWDSLDIMRTIQFPWRFLSTAIFFLSVVCGYVVYLLKPIKLRFTVGCLFLLVFCIPSLKYFKPDSYAQSLDTYYYSDEKRIRREMSSIWPDFLPKGFNEKLPPTDERVSLSKNESEKSKVKVDIDRSQQLLLSTSFSQPTILTIHIADFPGWTTFLNGKEVDHQVNKDGLIELLVPQGEQTIGVDFRDTPLRAFSVMISLMTGFLLLVYSFMKPIQGNRHD